MPIDTVIPAPKQVTVPVAGGGAFSGSADLLRRAQTTPRMPGRWGMIRTVRHRSSS